MVIRIKKVDYDSIVRYCLDGLPNESCGLIAGFVDGDVKSVEKVYFLTNLDHNNVHFTMDPKEQFAAVKDARSLGLTMLGNFHSHPETPSRPSEGWAPVVAIAGMITRAASKAAIVSNRATRPAAAGISSLSER